MLRIKVGILVLAVFWGATAFSAPPSHFPVIRTETDFRSYTYSHILRVVILGMRARELFPEIFFDIPKNLLHNFLMEHDEEKINSSRRFVKEYGGNPAEEPYSHFLAKHFGEPISRTSPDHVMIEHLNQLGNAKAWGFFRRHGLVDEDGNLKPAAQLLLRIERIADLVDRDQDKMAPIEFGRAKTLGVSLLVSFTDRKIARALIKEYIELTDGFHYWEIKDHFRQNPGEITKRVGVSCSRWLELMM